VHAIVSPAIKKILKKSSPAIIKLCCYIVYFNNYNHIVVATLRGRGAAAPL